MALGQTVQWQKTLMTVSYKKLFHIQFHKYITYYNNRLWKIILAKLLNDDYQM